MTAYFKTYYPIEFMSATLTVFADKEEKVQKYMKELERMNIDVLPPDLNQSGQGFTIEDHSLRFGLGSVKGLGEKVIAYIQEARPFASLEDLIERSPKKSLPKGSLETLVYAGALDDLGKHFTSRLHILQYLFDLRNDKIDLNDQLAQWTHRMKLDYERQKLGVYVTGHPLDGIAPSIDWVEVQEGPQFDTFGALVTWKVITTKRNDQMAFLTLDTLEGQKEFVLFPEAYEKFDGPWIEGLIFKVSVKVQFNPQRGEYSNNISRAHVPKRINRALLEAESVPQ